MQQVMINVSKYLKNSSRVFIVQYIDSNCITDQLVPDKLMPAYPTGPCKSCQNSGVSNRLPPDLWENH